MAEHDNNKLISESVNLSCKFLLEKNMAYMKQLKMNEDTYKEKTQRIIHFIYADTPNLSIVDGIKLCEAVANRIRIKLEKKNKEAGNSLLSKEFPEV